MMRTTNNAIQGHRKAARGSPQGCQEDQSKEEGRSRKGTKGDELKMTHTLRDAASRKLYADLPKDERIRLAQGFVQTGRKERPA